MEQTNRLYFLALLALCMTLLACDEHRLPDKDRQNIVCQLDSLTQTALANPAPTMEKLKKLSANKVVVGDDSLRMAVLKLKGTCHAARGEAKQAFANVEKALSIRFRGDDHLRAACYINLGNYTTVFLGDCIKSKRYLSRVDSILSTLNDDIAAGLKVQNHICWSQYYRLTDNPGMVFEHGLAGLKGAIAHNDSNQAVMAALQCVVISFEHADWSEAEHYGLLAERYIPRGRKNPWTGFVLQNLHSIYSEKREYDKARNYLRLCRKWNAENSADSYFLAKINNDEAMLDIAEGKYERAEKLLLQVEAGRPPYQNYNLPFETSYALVKVYTRKGQLDRAAVYAEKALSQLRQAYTPWNLKQVGFGILAEYARKKGDLKAALTYVDSMNVAKDSVVSRQRFVTRSVLDAQYESEKKENEIAMGKLKLREMQRQRLYFIIMGILLTISLCAIVFYLSYKMRTYRQLIERNKVMSDTTHRLLEEDDTALEVMPSPGEAAENACSRLDENVSGLSHETLNTIRQRLKRVMREDKIYRQSAVSLDYVAHCVGTNRTYLSTIINRQMGKSFTEYINFYRIEEAKELLLTTNKKVIEIGQEVGFNSTQSFYSAFKKQTGVSPSVFRKVKVG